MGPAAHCPRCSISTAAELLPQYGGICPRCLVRFVGETDVPVFPNLEILSAVGRGGMGVVYKARQSHLDRVVALKALSPRLSNNPEFLERFTREGKALAQLGHSNIVAVHDFGIQDGVPYLIMEYVEGKSLRRLMKDGGVAPRQALEIVPQLCDALHFAHSRGVVHRDVKPENILIDREGRVKIADFGLAKMVSIDERRITDADKVMGTPHYMAPEQLERPGSVDHRADIYSLGVIFYEILTGQLPLGRFKPPSQCAPVDVRFDPVVLKSLEWEPGDRYQSAAEVKEHVTRLRSIPRESTRKVRHASRRWRFAALGAALVAAALTFVLLARPSSKPPGPAPPPPPTGWIGLADSGKGGGLSRTPGLSYRASLALDAAGNPVVAWCDTTGGNEEIYVRRFDGSAWVDFGGGPNVSRSAAASSFPSLALDASGSPVVAWAEQPGQNSEIHVRRFNGREWEEIAGSASGGGISGTPGTSDRPDIAIDRRGRISVAWQDDSFGGIYAVHLRRFEGTTWAEVGKSASGAGVSGLNAAEADLTLDDQGNPWVVWTALASARRDDSDVYLRYFDGTRWADVGGSGAAGGVSQTPGSRGGVCSVALDRAGRPCVAWAEVIAGKHEIYFRRWNGASWAELGGSASGGGISRNAGTSGRPVAAFDLAGEPVVAWYDNSTGNYEIYLRRWDGAAWVELDGSATGGGITKNPGASMYPDMALDPQGHPVVVWNDDHGRESDIYLLRWRPAR